MADEEGYLLSREAAERMADVVRQVEGQPIARRAQSGRPVVRGPNLQTIRVTSTTTVSGRYPGKLNTYSATGNSYTESTDVWVVPTTPTDALIAAYYECKAVGEANGRMVFKTEGEAFVDRTFVTDVCPIFGAITLSMITSAGALAVTGTAGTLT